jgi:hypothetical protein
MTTSVRSGLTVTVAMCDQLRVALDHLRISAIVTGHFG